MGLRFVDVLGARCYGVSSKLAVPLSTGNGWERLRYVGDTRLKRSTSEIVEFRHLKTWTRLRGPKSIAMVSYNTLAIS